MGGIEIDDAKFFTVDGGEIAIMHCDIGIISGVDTSPLPDFTSTIEGKIHFKQTKVTKRFLRMLGLRVPKDKEYSKNARKWK